MVEDNGNFFKGETLSRLKGIDTNISEMKLDIKSINLKIDGVEESARNAADRAQLAAAKVMHQEEVNNTRHEENKRNLENIGVAINKLTKDQSDTKLRLYVMAAFLGGGTGVVVPWLKDLFM